MNVLNFFVSDAHAMAPGGQQGGGGYEGIIMLVIMFAIFYFLLIRPQQKRAKMHKELTENLSLGDPVVTAGGIHGKVSGLQEKVITVEIASGVKIKINRASIVSKQGEDIA
jgi:preprotein translocase subunit YajC